MSNPDAFSRACGFRRGLLSVATLAFAAAVLAAAPASAAGAAADARDDNRENRWEGMRFGVVHSRRAADATGAGSRGAAAKSRGNKANAAAPAARSSRSGGGAASGSVGGSRVATGTGKNGFQVLYDAEPGVGFQKPVANATKYIIVYQDDADHGARTGRIDPSKVVARVRAILDEGGASQWGVLDFEDPYDDIFRAGPSDPRYAPAMESLVATIRAVKQQFPQTKWTYYAFPRVPYWIGANGDKQWVQVDAATREAELDRILDRYAPVMNELDWFQTSVYDMYERSLDMPISLVGRDEAEADWRRASVEVVKRWFERTGAQAPPVIPAVSPWFQPGGRALKNRAIPLAEFVEDQIRPLAEAGASGVSVWSAMDWFIDVSTRENTLLSATGQAARDEMRGIFASEYLRTNPSTVEWTSTATRRTLGDACNQTLRQAMIAIAAAGEAARAARANPSSATAGSGGSLASGDTVAKPSAGE